MTAGNASPLNDGAAAVLIGDAAGAEAAGLEPLARIAGRGTFAVDPDIFGIGAGRGRQPRARARRASAGATSTWSSSTRRSRRSRSPASASGRTSTRRSVNVNGGAIAIGHPLGASGGRILGTLAHELQRRGGGWGVAAICIGVGQGLAVVIEA